MSAKLKPQQVRDALAGIPITSAFGRALEQIFEVAPGWIAVRHEFEVANPITVKRLHLIFAKVLGTKYKVETKILEYRSPNEPHDWIREEDEGVTAFSFTPR